MIHPLLERWLQQRCRTPFPFQRQTWEAYRAGCSGLVHAPTGMGKTLAVWLGPVAEMLDDDPAAAPPGCVLWLTPLRALANDTVEALREPIEDLRLPWTVDLRTGDTGSAARARQRQRLPTALVTTPESLSLLLSYADAADRFGQLRCVIVDEWHELLGTKRGTQTQLALARLRRWNPTLRVWGLSATLGNLDVARDALLGKPARPVPRPPADHADAPITCGAPAVGTHRTTPEPVLITAPQNKPIALETLIPPDIERFAWSGHLGIRLLSGVLEAIESAHSTLLFTNTRSQAEIWFQQILTARPDWVGTVALHHGSIDRGLRQQVERLLHDGALRCVVCTSSLDLGVDFSPVDLVIQVGSPKGVARLMQRAGRSGHAPGGVSRMLGVPTHALELIEFAAARTAIEQREIESRTPPALPLDVLAQHLVTVATGGGFVPHDMLDEVRSTHAFADLTDEQWQWCLDFVMRGGPTLRAYPQYARVVAQPDGRCVVASAPIARRHRMTIGTITSDAAVKVAFANGRTLGTVEEGFIAHVRAGDHFVFGGHLLELIQLREMTALVRKAAGRKAVVPRWQGGKSPLSTQLAAAVRRELDSFRRGEASSPEMRAVAPLLALQQRWSILPGPDELLIESIRTRDGHHAFVYPFAGRSAHEGLGALIAHRLARIEPRSIAVVVNDYGLELLSPTPLQLTDEDWRRLLATDALLDDLLACVNGSELARRAFRDIARVAGLICTGYPGQGKSARQLQASSELFFDVFSEFDPRNLLLEQARREVLDKQLEVGRIRSTLQRLAAMTLRRLEPASLTPLAFPLWAEHLREQHVSSERWTQRVQRAAQRLEREATRSQRKERADARHGRRRGRRHDLAVADD